jgi:hypothetical protein
MARPVATRGVRGTLGAVQLSTDVERWRAECGWAKVIRRRWTPLGIKGRELRSSDLRRGEREDRLAGAQRYRLRIAAWAETRTAGGVRDVTLRRRGIAGAARASVVAAVGGKSVIATVGPARVADRTGFVSAVANTVVHGARVRRRSSGRDQKRQRPEKTGDGARPTAPVHGAKLRT